jgi:predicted AAA+ superfamily ATPase
MTYKHRVVDIELDELLRGLPAIAIEGAKAVGKTATAERRATTVHRLDDPDRRSVLDADLGRIARDDPPVLLDEWQRLPASWDAVRRAVDDDPVPGRFLLTGSASPSNPPTHSGAGRIVSLRMRPLSLHERDPQDHAVSVAALLAGTAGDLEGATTWTLPDYVEAILASGLPAVSELPERARRAQLDGYLQRVVDHDFAELGQRVRNPAALTRWMTAYAAATSTTASFEVIRDASTSGQGEKPARSTTIPYRDALESLWLVEPVPAWLPTGNRLRQLGEKPKHQLADPALAARLLGVSADVLLDGGSAGPAIPRDGTLLGHLFESLVTMCLRVYAQASEATIKHLRTHSGAREVDLIIERADERIVGVEVKLSPEVRDHDVKHLHWLREKLGEQVVDLIVITTGKASYRRKDRVAVVPAALLGP